MIKCVILQFITLSPFVIVLIMTECRGLGWHSAHALYIVCVCVYLCVYVCENVCAINDTHSTNEMRALMKQPTSGTAFLFCIGELYWFNLDDVHGSTRSVIQSINF